MLLSLANKANNCNLSTTPSEQKPPKTSNKANQPLSNAAVFAKYGSMALQMGAIICIGAFVGIQIDKRSSFGHLHIFTLVFSVLSVIGAIYYFVRDFLPKK